MNFLFPSIHSTVFLPFLSGWIGDRLLGDPPGIPHPIVAFGKAISFGEKKLNHGEHKHWKGLVLTMVLVCGTFLLSWLVLKGSSRISPLLTDILIATGVFFCLAGKTLIMEVKAVFEKVEHNIEDGRLQLSRIVGRDTSDLSSQEIRIAALETLAENLSDGVIAPMCWFAIGGLPGMMAYKMINTLDSMIGYKNERYEAFGKAAALLDDVANYIPARLTAFVMLLVSGNWKQAGFVRRFARAHTSPNSGYPEAAMAGILDCRFGGTHSYFGISVEKPYIGENDRMVGIKDLQAAIRVNNRTELVIGLLVCIIVWFR